MNTSQVMDLAFAKGKQKKWAVEKLILEMLYESKDSKSQNYIRVNDVDKITYFDAEDNDFKTISFGYQFRFPKTTIWIKINKKTGKVFIERDDIGYGFEEVEKSVIEYIRELAKKGLLEWQTNLNDNSFPIKF